MKICFIGKYPPIEGGVSAQTYWVARGLAERGHEVYVVTNAGEVEDAFRMRLDDADARHREPEFPATGGFVKVFFPERLGPRMSHIPRANPFVSKLAGLATQVVSDFDCQVIVAYYFEPYAVAGHLAASWTGVPLLVQHAGSDLDRLMRIPELATTYKQVLRAADGVITTSGLVRRFAGMGLRPEAIHVGPPHPPPPVFNPDAEPLRPADVAGLALAPPVAPSPPRVFDPRLPTIGMYGKPGVVKGTYDLIGALARLRAAGPRFNLLLMVGTAHAADVAQAIVDGDLEDRTWLLPYVPHWKVPRFIRTCTAVCFLERDFPIAIHGPTVPREVLACGTCLVLSGEILGKQYYRDRLEDGVNLVVAADPQDRTALADRLRSLIEQPERAREIGARGHLVAAGFAPYGDSAEAWEALLTSFANGAPEPAAQTGDGVRPEMPDRISAVLPWLRPALDAPDDLLSRFKHEREDADPGLGDVEMADEFCAFLEGRNGDLAGHPGLTGECLRDIVRYQRARFWAARDDSAGAGHVVSPPVTNVLSGRRPSPENIRDLCPVVGVPIRVEQFDHDVTPLFCHVGPTRGDAIPDWADALAELRPTTTFVCFARLPNLAPCEQRINAATERLLARCDGRRSTEEIAALLARETDAGIPVERLVQEICTILLGFYSAGIVVFHKPPALGAPAFTPADTGAPISAGR